LQREKLPSLNKASIHAARQGPNRRGISLPRTQQPLM
jgi:hypothetical protein